MRLDRELGTLNREIVAIKEKWKIALNIDSKKVAIEKLITRRKRLRDTDAVLKMVEDATNDEVNRKLNYISSAAETKVDKIIEKAVEERDEYVFDKVYTKTNAQLKDLIVEKTQGKLIFLFE